MHRIIVAVAFLLTCSIAVAQRPDGAPRAALNRAMPEIRFTHVTLAEGIDFLRDVSGANLTVNWAALELVNVTRDTPISLRAKSITLRKALSLVLAEAAPRGVLGWHVDGGVIEITTWERVHQRLVMIVYPVHDLLLEVPDFSGPSFNLEANNSAGRNSGGIGIGDREGRNRISKSRRERGEALAQLIREVVRPEVWRENGGRASIRYFNGNLIVSAPMSVHELIGGRR